MPRKYVAKGRYNKYDVNLIAEAVKAYKSGKSSLKSIADKFEIDKSVLYRHATRTMKRHGGQTALSEDTEKIIINYIHICNNWGYTLDSLDLRFLVKYYLDKIGRTVLKFKNNLPGPDFVRSFLKRHKDQISQRSRPDIENEVDKSLFALLDILNERRCGERKRKLQFASSEYDEEKELVSVRKKAKEIRKRKKQRNDKVFSDKKVIYDKKNNKKSIQNVNDLINKNIDKGKGKGKKIKGIKTKKDETKNACNDKNNDTNLLNNAQNNSIACFCNDIIKAMSINVGDFIVYDGNEIVIAENFLYTEDESN